MAAVKDGVWNHAILAIIKGKILANKSEGLSTINTRIFRDRDNVKTLAATEI
jgi:hypothetical protein